MNIGRPARWAEPRRLWSPGRVLLVLSLAVVAAAWTLEGLGSDVFQPLFGPRSPLLVTVVATLVGAACLAFLVTYGGCDIHRKEEGWKGLVRSTTLATALAFLMIMVDVWVVFSKDFNVSAPDSILFYPAIAYVAEVVFHLVPLAVLLALFGRFFDRRPGKLAWVLILPVSVLEPLFQLGGASLGDIAPWVEAYVGIHILLINVLQLWTFKRYGFLSMYAFRLIYYLSWHVVWGYLRLSMLF